MQEQTEALIALSTEQGFALYLSAGTILQGWVLVEQGQGEKGIEQIHQGLVAYRATGAELLRPSYLILLAEAYGKTGQAEEGLSTLSEALTLANKTGGRYYEAEMYRLKGELTLAQSSVQSLESGVQTNQKAKGKKQKLLTPNSQAEAEAEACFLKAIEIARKQQAKSWELRAATSLARLWQQQGKQHEARELLSEIYGWFIEGFDTKDLQEAKTLLEQLGYTAECKS